jgi:hypothetical protein
MSPEEYYIKKGFGGHALSPKSKISGVQSPQPKEWQQMEHNLKTHNVTTL